MAPVFSERFFVQKGLSGTSSAVIVPAGYTFIVKQITLYMSSTLATIDAFLEDAGSGAALFHGGVSAGGGAWFGFYGALVFAAGESFQFNVVTSLGESADVYAGGYRLTD